MKKVPLWAQFILTISILGLFGLGLDYFKLIDLGIFPNSQTEKGGTTSPEDAVNYGYDYHSMKARTTSLAKKEASQDNLHSRPYFYEIELQNQAGIVYYFLGSNQEITAFSFDSNGNFLGSFVLKHSILIQTADGSYTTSVSIEAANKDKFFIPNGIKFIFRFDEGYWTFPVVKGVQDIKIPKKDIKTTPQIYNQFFTF